MSSRSVQKFSGGDTLRYVLGIFVFFMLVAVGVLGFVFTRTVVTDVDLIPVVTDRANESNFTDSSQECVDEDGDGYGDIGCELGLDCDDTNPSTNVVCSLPMRFDLIEKENVENAGNNIFVEVRARNVPDIQEIEAIELIIDYNKDVLDVKQIEKPTSKYLIIENILEEESFVAVDNEFNGRIELDSVTFKGDYVAEDDIIAVINFTPKTQGVGKISVNTNSKVGVYYSFEPTKLEVDVE